MGTQERILPTKGDKEFRPSHSWLEDKQIQRAIDERKALLEEERVVKLGNLARAEWNDELKEAEVTRVTGKHWQVIGHERETKIWLYPEEALYLLEMDNHPPLPPQVHLTEIQTSISPSSVVQLNTTNALANYATESNLELMYGGVALSVQQAYSVVLGCKTGCTLDEYRTYAHLMRQGYRVMRHSPSLKVTNYERTIGLHEHVLRQKNKGRRNQSQVGHPNRDREQGSLNPHISSDSADSDIEEICSAASVKGVGRVYHALGHTVVSARRSEEVTSAEHSRAATQGSLKIETLDECTEISLVTNNSSVVGNLERAFGSKNIRISSEIPSGLKTKPISEQTIGDSSTLENQTASKDTLEKNMKKSLDHQNTDKVKCEETNNAGEISDKDKESNADGAKEELLAHIVSATIEENVDICKDDSPAQIRVEKQPSFINANATGSTPMEVDLEVGDSGNEVDGHTDSHSSVLSTSKGNLQEINQNVDYSHIEDKLNNKESMDSAGLNKNSNNCSQESNSDTLNADHSVLREERSPLAAEVSSEDEIMIVEGYKPKQSSSVQKDADKIVNEKSDSKLITKSAELIDITDGDIHAHSINKQTDDNDIVEIGEKQHLTISSTSTHRGVGQNSMNKHNKRLSTSKTCQNVVDISDDDVKPVNTNIEEEMAKFYNEIEVIDLDASESAKLTPEERKAILNEIPSAENSFTIHVKTPPEHLLPPNSKPKQKDYYIQLWRLKAVGYGGRPVQNTNVFASQYGRNSVSQQNSGQINPWLPYVWGPRANAPPPLNAHHSPLLPTPSMYVQPYNMPPVPFNNYPNVENPGLSAQTMFAQASRMFLMAQNLAMGSRMPYQNQAHNYYKGRNHTYHHYRRRSYRGRHYPSWKHRNPSNSTQSTRNNNMPNYNQQNNLDRRASDSLDSDIKPSSSPSLSNYGSKKSDALLAVSKTKIEESSLIIDIEDDDDEIKCLTVSSSASNRQRNSNNKHEPTRGRYLNPSRKYAGDIKNIGQQERQGVKAEVEPVETIAVEPEGHATGTLKISFDLFLPVASFRKCAPGLPNYRLVVFGFEDPLPTPADISWLLRHFEDGVPLLFSVVSPDSVSFFQFSNVDIPVDFESRG
uniref:tRNA-splicing endonuclease subunit Sen54 N-terminal domain-containing protein n=1 Tax=Timema shepardi TaxID=629360 RepID=A0A7R9ANV6_TIMSH|nr:unnamed protein product [Timema shepardi]